MNIFRKIYEKIFLRNKKHLFTMTPKGMYLFNYIIKKYVEEQDTAENQVYEDIITHFKMKLTERGKFEILFSTMPMLEDSAEFRQAWAAFSLASVIYHNLIPSDQERCLALIKDEEIKQQFLSLQSQF